MHRIASSDFKYAYLMMICVLIYILISFITFNQIEEDAYIYFRIAANYADGHGFFVFNHGGESIESGSSLLWQLYLSFLYLLFPDLLIATKLTSIVIACVCLWLVWRLASGPMECRSWPQLLPVALLISSAPFYMWMQRGLETPLYLLLIIAYAACLMSSRFAKYWYLFAFLVFCARPEGFIYFAAALSLLLYADQRKLFWRGLPIYILLCAIVVAFRFFYFQDLVQHPFYIKLRGSPELGLEALAAWFRLSQVVWLTPLAGLLLLRGFWSRQAVVCALFAAIALYWAVSGEDWKPYNRHLVPALPFLFLLLARGLTIGLNRWRTMRAFAAVYLLSTTIAMLLASDAVTRYQMSLPNPVKAAIGEARRVNMPLQQYVAGLFDKSHHAGLRIEESRLRDPIAYTWYTPLANFIELNYPQNIKIVFDQMGQVPWETGLNRVYIDSAGLLDRRVGFYRFQNGAESSRLHLLFLKLTVWLDQVFWQGVPRQSSQAEILDYLFSQQPDLIIVTTLLADSESSLQWQIERDERIRRDYTKPWYVNGFRVYERADRELRDIIFPSGYGADKVYRMKEYY